MRTAATHGTRRVWRLALAVALAVGTRAGAAPDGAEFYYMKSLKEAESNADAPAVFAQLEAMDPARRAAFAEERRDLFERLRTMRSLAGDLAGALQASTWIDIGVGMPARYAVQGGEALARVFMVVGYGPASKQTAPRADGWKSVATLLRERLGVDPLTIDQSIMHGRGDARVEHPQYRAAMTRFAPTGPVVLKAAAGGHVTIGVRPGGYELQVFHPDETMHGPHGRPLWMERQAGLRPQPVPASLLPASGRRLVQAFHAADGPGAVPADMVMVEAGKPAPSLMLPEGQFRFAYEE